MSDHDERRLADVGREVWPDPDSAYRELLVVRARHRRRAAGLGGVAAFAAAVAAFAFLVFPGGHPAASRGIVVAGGPSVAPATITATTPTPSGRAAAGLATPTPAPTSEHTTSPAQTVLASPAVGAVVSATDTVGANPRFEPATVTIFVGMAVKFVNTGAAAHTATASNGSWSTGNLSPGQSATTPAFQTPGRYTYYCLYHRSLGMVGTIVVETFPALGPGPLPGVVAVPESTATPTPASTATPTPIQRPSLTAGKVVPSPIVNP